MGQPNDDEDIPSTFYADGMGVHAVKTPFEAHKEMYEKHQMAVAEVRSAIRTMMMNLNKDDIYALYRLLQGMTNDSAIEMAAFYSGVLSAIMDLNYGLCNCCGKPRHDPGDLSPDQFGTPDGEAH